MNKIKKYLKRYFILSFIIFWIYYLISTSIWTYVMKDPREMSKGATIGLIAVSWCPIYNNIILYKLVLEDYKYYKLIKEYKKISKELNNENT